MRIKRPDNKGITLIELIIVIAIMGVLVGVISPMFVKYVDKSKKAKDVNTADQIAKAVNIAFVENPEAYAAYQNWKSSNADIHRKLSVTVNGEVEEYWVYLVASNGPQTSSNKNSNCFNGTTADFKGGPGGDSRGSTGFYGVVNRELGLSTTEMNPEIIPK